MFASVQRDDGAFIRINLNHIVYAYPANGQPNDPAVILLTTGDTVSLKDSLADLFNKVDPKAARGA